VVGNWGEGRSLATVVAILFIFVFMPEVPFRGKNI